MEVLSPHPVPVGILYWNAPTRRATIIAKMTLVPKNGHLVLADEQEPLRAAIPSAMCAADELQDPGDFVPYKPRCDVLFVGSARSKTATRLIPFHFKIGALERIVYAHAGKSTQTIPLSRVYLRDKPMNDANPVSVGPLSMQHPDRARVIDARLPTRAAAFERTTLPAMFDGRSFNAAPPEQQIDPLVPGVNLTVTWGVFEAPSVTYWIPPTKPRIFLLDDNAPSGLHEIATTCDTLLVDMDRDRCVLTFRGMLAPDRESRFPPRIVVVFASAHDSLMPGAAAAICAQAKTRRVTEVHDIEPLDDDDAMELDDDALEVESEPSPLTHSTHSPREMAVPQRSSVLPPAPASVRAPAPSTLQSAAATNPSRASTLPFVQAPSDVRSAAATTRPRTLPDDEESTSFHQVAPERTSVLPFVPAHSSTPPDVRPAPLEHRTRSKYDDDESTKMHAPVPARAAALPFVSAPADVRPAPVQTRTWTPIDDDESTKMHAVAPSRASGLPFVSAQKTAPPDVRPAAVEHRTRSTYDDDESTKMHAVAPVRASTLPFVSAHGPTDDEAGASASDRKSVLPFVAASASPAQPASPRHDGLPFVAAHAPEVSQPSSGLPFVSSGLPFSREAPSAPPLTSALPFVSAYPPHEGLSERMGAGSHGLGHRSTLGDEQAASIQAPSFVLAIPGQSPETAAIQVLSDASPSGKLSIEAFAEIKMHVWSGATLREALAAHGVDQRTYHLFERRHASEMADETKQGNLERARALRAALRRAREKFRPVHTEDILM